MDAGADEAVVADGLHVDVHVPEEDAEAHEAEEDGEHEDAEGRRFPDLEGQDWFFGDPRFPVCEGGEVDDGDDEENDFVDAAPPYNWGLTRKR